MNIGDNPALTVRIERIIPASPHRVYRAWLDPDTLRRWLAPGGMRLARAEVDARVGGCYRIWHADGETDVGGFDCELLELVPDSRLVFRWGFVGPARSDGPIFDSRLTITLRDAPGGTTLLTLVHEQLDDLATAMPDVARQVGSGWKSVLDKLAMELGAAPSRDL